MAIREPIENRKSNNDDNAKTVDQERASIQDLELDVQRFRDEAIQQAELSRNEVVDLKEKQAAFDRDSALNKAEEGFSSTWQQQQQQQQQQQHPSKKLSQSTPTPPTSFTLLEGVDKNDPRLSEYIRNLLDQSTSPEERNRLLYTNPPFDEAFGSGPNTYYPDHIPLPGFCHWTVSLICLALGGVILSGEIKTHKGPTDAVAAAVILLLICVVPALWCLRWGRRSHIKRKDLFIDDLPFPGRLRQGYYTIGTAALVDYNEKSGVCVFPVDHIVNMYSKTTGSGGGRTTSKHLVYRTTLEEETEMNEGSGGRWCCGKNINRVQKMITLDGHRNGDQLIYWWKHKVKGIATWSEQQAQPRTQADSQDNQQLILTG